MNVDFGNGTAIIFTQHKIYTTIGLFFNVGNL